MRTLCTSNLNIVYLIQFLILSSIMNTRKNRNDSYIRLVNGLIYIHTEQKQQQKYI